jgi:hypothetical protein
MNFNFVAVAVTPWPTKVPQSEEYPIRPSVIRAAETIRRGHVPDA